jgi:hypothetical protein
MLMLMLTLMLMSCSFWATSVVSPFTRVRLLRRQALATRM